MGQSKFPDRKPFVTGSHAYGKPRPDSDIDLVVFLSEKDMARLQKLDAGKMATNLAQNYIAAGGRPLQFGKLNLICCTDQRYYDIWREGTLQLKKLAPVKRADAIKHFHKMRGKAGLWCPPDHELASDWAS